MRTRSLVIPTFVDDIDRSIAYWFDSISYREYVQELEPAHEHRSFHSSATNIVSRGQQSDIVSDPDTDDHSWMKHFHEVPESFLLLHSTTARRVQTHITRDLADLALPSESHSTTVAHSVPIVTAPRTVAPPMPSTTVPAPTKNVHDLLASSKKRECVLGEETPDSQPHQTTVQRHYREVNGGQEQNYQNNSQNKSLHPNCMMACASSKQDESVTTRDGYKIIVIGRGGPIRDLPNNQKYLDIIQKHSREYKHATHARRRDMKKQLHNILRNMGFRFYKKVQVKKTTKKNGHGKHRPVVSAVVNRLELKEMTETVIVATIGRAFLDVLRCDKYWYWVDEISGTHLYKFGNKAATRLEEMFHQDANDRTIVEVTIDNEQYLVDLNEWEMHKRNDNNFVVEVGRKTPSQEADSKTSITVTDSDMEQDDNAPGEPSSSTGCSENGDQTGVSSLVGESTSGAWTQLCYNNLGLVGDACHEIFYVNDGIDFTICEATQEEIYDAISIVLEESCNEERTSDGVTTKSLSNLAVSTDGESLDERHLSSSKPTSTKLASEEENLTDVAKSQPGAVRVDNTSKINDDVIWVWRENRTRMARHDATAVYRDPKDCWIRYDESTTKELEQAYKLSGNSGSYKVKARYQVDFATMRQTNTLSGYQREVKRIGFKERIVPIMMKTPDSMKLSPHRSIEVKASGVDTTLAKKMATVQLHEYNDKTADSFISSTNDDSRAGADLGTAK